jgi:hypothetical protein
MGRRQLAIGFIMLIGGLVVVAIGTAFPSGDPLVAIGWLLFVPVLVAFCGTIFVFAGLARSPQTARRTPAPYRTVGSAAVAGLGLALGYGAAGIISQVPDSLAGLNGPFVPGPAAGLAAFTISTIGLSAGLVIGATIALMWWSVRGRHLPAEAGTHR